ncbi:hypothetical protein C8R43DRAFT_1230978 [Mycena crocata]|nr:hypothetical protein C8R43DRAFT_1230978 [Mycena crocata]
MASATNHQSTTLTEFIHQLELNLVTGDDACFEATLAKYWSPRGGEENVATGEHLTHAAFRRMLWKLRREISNRALVSETFVIATPHDETERTGAVGYTHVFKGVQAGVAVTVTAVAVLRVNWVEEDTRVRDLIKSVIP